MQKTLNRQRDLKSKPNRLTNNSHFCLRKLKPNWGNSNTSSPKPRNSSCSPLCKALRKLSLSLAMWPLQSQIHSLCRYENLKSSSQWCQWYWWQYRINLVIQFGCHNTLNTIRKWLLTAKPTASLSVRTVLGQHQVLTCQSVLTTLVISVWVTWLAFLNYEIIRSLFSS